MPHTRTIDQLFSVTIRSNSLPRDAGWEAMADVFETATCKDIGISVTTEGRSMIDAEARAFRKACERLYRRNRSER